MGVLTLALVLAVMADFLSPASSCSCFYRHPQQHVCEADFVVFARVRKVTHTPDGLTAYKVKVKRILKASEKVELILQKGLIYSIPGTCEMKLESRTSQVITGNVEGGKPWTNLCHYAKPWRTLSSKMKKGFRLLYERGCDCPIMSCAFWEDCPKASFLCAWETSNEENDCQGRHAVCLRGQDGTCDWLGGRLYRECMKPRRKQLTNEITVTDNKQDNNINSKINTNPRRRRPSRFGYKRPRLHKVVRPRKGRPYIHEVVNTEKAFVPK
ncbi:metalloproteinase inhibitor 2-like [Macrobrachium nipponense]|uniref:metalloproteinase inhibitor 2-like n=1 Tax=Macrobrachium nipponense TaxID=159736 RepID=UPI0030C7EB42